MNNINDLLVQELQSKSRELAARKKLELQKTIITNEMQTQAEIREKLAVEKYKIELNKVDEVKG